MGGMTEMSQCDEDRLWQDGQGTLWTHGDKPLRELFIPGYVCTCCLIWLYVKNLRKEWEKISNFCAAVISLAVKRHKTILWLFVLFGCLSPLNPDEQFGRCGRCFSRLMTTRLTCPSSQAPWRNQQLPDLTIFLITVGGFELGIDQRFICQTADHMWTDALRVV